MSNVVHNGRGSEREFGLRPDQRNYGGRVLIYRRDALTDGAEIVVVISGRISEHYVVRDDSPKGRVAPVGGSLEGLWAWGLGLVACDGFQIVGRHTCSEWESMRLSARESAEGRR